MNMADEHIDFDLIMALAEGTLPPGEAAAAEAGLSSRAAEELAAQRDAIAALGELSPPEMTLSERETVRSSVRDALNLSPAPAPASRPAPIRQPWYARAFPVLAGLAAAVVVVGVGISVVGDGIGGGDDAAEVAAEATAAEPAAGGDAVSQLNQLDRAEDTGSDADSSADSAEAAGAPSEASLAADEPIEEALDDAADAETSTTAAAADDGAAGGFVQFAYVGDLSSSAGTLADAMLAAAESFGTPPMAVDEAVEFFSALETAACWQEAIDEADSIDEPVEAIVGAGFGMWDADRAEFYEFLRADDQIIVVILREDCTVAQTELR